MKKVLGLLMTLACVLTFVGCSHKSEEVAPANKINKTVVDAQLTSGLNYVVSLTGVTVAPCDLKNYYECKQGGALSVRNNGSTNCNSGWEGTWSSYESEGYTFFVFVGQLIYTDSNTKKHTFRTTEIENGILKGSETLYAGTAYETELKIELSHNGTPRQ